MADNDWAKKYLDDLNKKLNIPAKQEENRNSRERPDAAPQGKRDKRRRRSRGKNRDERKGRKPETRTPQAQPAPKPRHLNGFVMRIEGGRYTVMAENRPVVCSVDAPVLRNGPLHVGDRVRLAMTSKQEGRIDKYEPRQNFVSCPVKQNETILAANVNQVMLVVSVKEPVLRTDWMDRHLIVCERRGFKPVICCSKIDLADDNSYLEHMEYYRRMGYRVVYVSAVLPTSLHDVRNLLKSKTTVFTGHTAVGKTTIIDLLAAGEAPKPNLQTGETEHSDDYKPTDGVICHKLSTGGYVIDTPGLTEYEFSGVDKRDLRKYFRDFRHFNFQCALPDCMHEDEPGCKVRDAVQDGDILDERYDTYLKILENLA